MTDIVSGDKLQTSNSISAIRYFDGMTMKHNMSASDFIKQNIFDIISNSFYFFFFDLIWFDSGSHGLNHEELHIDNCKDFI